MSILSYWMHVGPPKPTEVEASKVTSTSATISWRLDLSKLHSDTAWKYKIHYSTKDGGKEQVIELKPVSEDPMSILVDGLDPCTEYEYSIELYVKDIIFSSSEVHTFTTSK